MGLLTGSCMGLLTGSCMGLLTGSRVGLLIGSCVGLLAITDRNRPPFPFCLVLPEKSAAMNAPEGKQAVGPPT